MIESALKRAADEMQEYVCLVIAGAVAMFSRPRYRYDIIEQFDLIGVRSLNETGHDQLPNRICAKHS